MLDRGVAQRHWQSWKREVLAEVLAELQERGVVQRHWERHWKGEVLNRGIGQRHCPRALAELYKISVWQSCGKEALVEVLDRGVGLSPVWLGEANAHVPVCNWQQMRADGVALGYPL